MARTSTLWRLLPARELGCGSATTCWRRLTEWVEAGVRLGSAATAGGSSAPGRGWAASGGCGSATSASLSGCRPWPCWPARSSASTPSSSHRGERPDGRSSRQARAPDARSPISIPIATGRPGLRWMGSGTAAARTGSNPRTPDTMACRIADSWNATVSRRRVGGCPPDTGLPSDVARGWHGRWHDPVSSYWSGP
jgi:hypothetical protein